MGLLLGALLALVPLLITPNLHLFFDVTPKVAVLLAGSSLALVLWIRDSRRGLISCRTYSRFYLLLLAALVWLVVATVLSTDRFLSITGTNWRRSGLPVHAALLVLAFTTANWLAGRQERVLPLLRVVSLAGLAASLYGILQYFGWDPWLPHVGYQAGEGEWTIVRPPSTLGHAGAFATWLLFPVFASIGLAYTEKGTVWRAIAVLSAAAGAMGIVVSGTRAALLALAAGGVLLAWWMRARVSRKLAAGALAAAVALAVFYYSPAGAMLRSRVHWIQEDVQGGARIWLFRDSLGMAGHRLILGYGPETFSKSFPRFESAELARAYPNFYHESPHNLFLDALLQTGIPGLAILLGLIALALLGGMRASRSNPLFKALCASLITCVISLQFTPAVPAIAFYCTFVAAILIAGTAPAPKAAARFPSLWAAGVALFAVALAAFAVRIWTADAMLRQADTAIGRGDIRRAAAEFSDATDWGANAAVWYSRRMFQTAQSASDPAVRLAAWQAAVAAAVSAPDRAEDPQNAFYNLAAFCAVQNDARCTEQYLRAAIAVAPNWYKAHWMLARLLQTTGRLKEAEAEAQLAADRNAGKDPEIAQTLGTIRAALKK